MSPRNLVAVILCSTVCLILLATVVGFLFYPPGTVTETARVKTYEILVYILGVVSGWLLSKETPPKQD